MIRAKLCLFFLLTHAIRASHGRTEKEGDSLPVQKRGLVENSPFLRLLSFKPSWGDEQTSVHPTEGISGKPKELVHVPFIEPVSSIVVICKDVGKGLRTCVGN